MERADETRATFVKSHTTRIPRENRRDETRGEVGVSSVHLSPSTASAMRLSVSVFIFTALLSAASSASLASQSPSRSAVLDLPVFEFPYNIDGGARAPGMNQSLGITASVYEATHTLLGRVAPSHPLLRNVGITVFDFMTISVPLTDAWLHEEWHRAVLGRNGVNSRNDVWNLRNIFAEAISVSHVSDDDLIRFKADRPADFVRMKAAGYEGEGELITRLETTQFFKNSKAWHVGLYWLVALNDQLYLGDVVSPADSAEIDSMTDKANLDEKTVQVRDVSGHDFTAWVYHLFRPQEPFSARGPHPSGVGINRYIRVGDLSAEEKRFLAREGKLAWLNFADPNFVGVRGFDIRSPFGGEPARANLWLRHTLTSFGHAIDAHIVYQQGALGIHATAQRFTNHERSFPGLRVEMVERPLRFNGRDFLFSPRAGVWAQPRGQEFRTRDASVGGLAGLRLETSSPSRFHYYVDVETKTVGWVAGRPNLGAGATLLTGFTYALTRDKR